MATDVVLKDGFIEASGGEMRSVGDGAGFSFEDRSATGEHANERWVIYAQEGILRLWHSQQGDVVKVFSSGLVQIRGEGATIHTKVLFADLGGKLGIGPMILDLLNRVKALEAKK